MPPGASVSTSICPSLPHRTVAESIKKALGSWEQQNSSSLLTLPFTSAEIPPPLGNAHNFARSLGALLIAVMVRKLGCELGGNGLPVASL